MKHSIYGLLFLLIMPVMAQAQNEAYPLGKLLLSNEEVVMSFKTKNRKIVTVNTDKNYGYIVFRYGDKDSVKFQYPKDLNENSWQQFTYYSSKQKNEKVDTDMEIFQLSFFYNGISYNVNQNLHIPTEDEDLELNITGIVDGCRLSAKPHTRIGSLATLQNSEVTKKETE